jgi:hypothetical protein
MSKAPVFIIGCPRSGTTLLSSFFESSIYGTPIETHFITKYYKKLYTYGNIEKKRNFRKIVTDIFKERPVMQWNINCDINKLYNDMVTFKYPEIVNKICMLRSISKNKTSWGDKTPHYLLDLDIIYKLYPSSKFVYIFRDGRDVALSLLKMPWGPNNIYACSRYWKKYNKETETFKLILNKGQLFIVRYEDLLINPRKLILNLLNFLKIDYHEDEISRLIKTIKTNNCNKWKKLLSEVQINRFENVSANTLKKLGYETKYEEIKINFAARLFWGIHDAIFNYYYLFKLNIIDSIKIKFFRKEPFAD